MNTTVAESPRSTLSGVARVLVHAGKLQAKAAEELVRNAASAGKDKKNGFVAAVIASGAITSPELAHTLSAALALPVLDLDAIDQQRLPRDIVDGKFAAQYQIIVLGRRGNRLFIGAADPTDQEANERIKFATQMAPEWVIVEHDKLAKLLEGAGASATESLEALTSGDFEFDVSEEAATP